MCLNPSIQMLTPIMRNPLALVPAMIITTIILSDVVTMYLFTGLVIVHSSQFSTSILTAILLSNMMMVNLNASSSLRKPGILKVMLTLCPPALHKL